MKPRTDQWTHHSFAHAKMITLYVGKDKVDFQVHEDTLFKASPLFRKAFTSDSQEGSEPTREFPDDDAGVFNHLIACIYAKTFDMDMFEDNMPDSEIMVQAAQLFALAEKYDVETVMLNICLKLHAHGKVKKQYVTKDGYHGSRLAPPERRAVEIAYNYTHRDSMLRMVFVDWYSVCHVREDTGVRDWLPTVPEFASDLVVASPEMQHFYKAEENYLLRLKGVK